MALHVGIADHFGWAVAVTAEADGTVVDRRRLELVDPDLSPAPIHYDAARLDDAELTDLIEAVRASITLHATVGYEQVQTAVATPIATLSLRSWPDDFPTDLATLRRSPWEARADAVLHRRVLAEVASARGWEVQTYEAKHITEGVGIDLDAPRALLGPPWTKDHRMALAAAITAARAAEGPR